MPSDISTTENPFLPFWDTGFKRLVPVVPPNAPVHEDSRLAARVRAGKDPRGKVPGVRNADGNWHGIDFTKCEAVRQDLDRWNAMGASVGIKTGRGIIAVDIDTINSAAAKQIYDAALAMLGPAKVRIGRKPKCLLVYRAPDDIGYSKVKFATDTEDSAAVEILAEGRQFIAHGIHPATAKPYTWPYGIPSAAADLTEITKGQLNAFLAHIAAEMPQALRQDASADREAPDQETLLAPDWEALKATVNAMPNAQMMFPTREDYVKVAYAIKGAAPQGYETEALELYLDWCDRWDGGTNDQDEALRDWQRAKPPYRVGYQYLQQNAVGLYFQPAGNDALEDMFGEMGQRSEQETKKTFLFKPVSVFSDRPMPTRDWVVPSLVPSKTVTLLTGDGGTGKSLIALQLAAAVALGKDWLGSEVRQGPVVVLSAEDDEDELHRRFDAVFRAMGEDMSLVDDLRFLSLAGEDAVLGALTGERIQATPLFKFFEQEIEKTKPVLVIYDTLADLFGGNEINRTQTRQFIGLLRGISVRHDCAGLLLGHPSVAGMQSGAGTSGSTAWSNSVRSRLYLERVQENGHEPNPDLRRLTTKKSNYGPIGMQLGLRYERGVFQVDDSAVTSGNGVGATKAQAAFLDALAQFTLQGRAVSSSPGANYAPKVFAESGLTRGSGYTKHAYRVAMDTLFSLGALRRIEEGRPGKRRSRLVALTLEERGFPEKSAVFD